MHKTSQNHSSQTDRGQRLCVRWLFSNQQDYSALMKTWEAWLVHPFLFVSVGFASLRWNLFAWSLLNSLRPRSGLGAPVVKCTWYSWGECKSLSGIWRNLCRVNGRSLERHFLYFEVAVEQGCFSSNLKSSIFCKKKSLLIFFTYEFLLIMILSFLLVIHFNQYFACTLYWLFLSIFSNRWIYDISGCNLYVIIEVFILVWV